MHRQGFTAARMIFTAAAISLIALSLFALLRITRVKREGASIPVYPGAREAGGRVRYFPRFVSWDDRSSARVQRIFALPRAMDLSEIARHADSTLQHAGWYLVSPDDIERIRNPQVIVWQRDPDQRLDLTQLWPVAFLTREQRLYGGIFPKEFLDAPQVIEWSWALGGPRSPRPRPVSPALIRFPPPPPPRQ
jgi:hypothetical protein